MGHNSHLRKLLENENRLTHIIIMMLIKRKNPHYLLNENWMVLHLNKLKSPSPKDVPWQVWLKLVQWFLRRRIFKISSMYFLLFRNNLFSEKGWALHLNRLESTSLKDALCQVWLKLVQWFLRRRFFLISSMYFCYFLIISPWKRAGLFIWTNLKPLHQECFVPSLVEIVVQEKKNVKSLRQWRRWRWTTDKAFGSGELKKINTVYNLSKIFLQYKQKHKLNKQVHGKWVVRIWSS